MVLSAFGLAERYRGVMCVVLCEKQEKLEVGKKAALYYNAV